MLREVSALQQAQSGIATRGGALHEYCADGYADGLCKQSQALACAADLLEKHAFDSYEAHVALRTVGS